VDAIAPTNAGSERVKLRNETAQKRVAYFKAALFCVVEVFCGMEGGTTDWNSRTEQRERPEGDRLIASSGRTEFSSSYVFHAEIIKIMIVTLYLT
jgi:hypothetical protein